MLRTGCSSPRLRDLSEYPSDLLLSRQLLTSSFHTGFQPHTRSAIPGWDALLFIYGIFLIPVLFALLVGVNLVVWARTRINYVFIFGESAVVFEVFPLRLMHASLELDIRTRLDHREYFEVRSSPSLTVDKTNEPSFRHLPYSSRRSATHSGCPFPV